MTAASTLSRRGVRALADAVHCQPVDQAQHAGSDICTWAFDARSYDHVEVPDLLVGVLTAGNVRWRNGSRTHSGCFRRGRVAVIPAATYLRMQPDSPLAAITVHISPERTNRIFGIDHGARLLERADLRLGLSNPLIASGLLALAAEIRHPSENGSVLTESLITMLLHQALHAPPDRSLSPGAGGLSARALALVEDYVQTHLADRIRLEDLARLAGLSPFHFSRAFKATAGKAPHQYLTDARVRQAMLLLRDPGRDITGIALDVGFSSHSHLCTTFRRVLGVSPAAYRRSLT